MTGAARPDARARWLTWFGRRGPSERFDLDVVTGGHFFDPAGERHVIQTVTDDLLRALAAREGAFGHA